jgi:hypothetical protein
MNRKLIAKIGISTMMVTAIGLSISAGASVWDDTKQKTNSVSGEITSVGTDEDKVVFTLKHDGQKETFQLCSSYPGGDGFNVMETERTTLVNQALSRGYKVRISYNSPFDRCVKSVDIMKEDDAPTKTALKVDVPKKAVPN